MAVMGKLRMFVVQEPVVAASCLIAGFEFLNCIWVGIGVDGPIVVESMKSDVFKVHIFLTKPCKSAARTNIFLVHIMIISIPASLNVLDC
ncbi:hypothetical protein H5410_011761 [Solanum commersonii]|uniref:Uncharacterized protein n=1 Tax=Solanum commersonii TaxID=4109 RepID=A0A9J6AR12_SOLCO|nr:hypothetical protein H5410_011761 [Solanum commersonii]